MKKNVLIIVVAITIVATGGGAFYGGVAYAKNQRNNVRNFQQGTGNMQGFGNRQQGGVGGFTMGDIISKDDKSVTVKLQDGGSRIIFLSDSMKVTKSTDGSVADLQVGTQIVANGTANSDGSITAQTIQLSPQLQMLTR